MIRDPEELWQQWTSLPIIGRQDLQDRFRPDDMAARFRLHGIASSTGGSTGEPTPFFHDDGMRRAVRSLTTYCWLKFGWRPGLPTAAVWGSERDIGKSRSWKGRITSLVANIHLLGGFEMAARTVDEVLAFVRRHEEVAIYGFTSMLEFIARETLARSDLPQPGRVRGAWNAAEMLFQSQSDLFRQAFGVPINNFYGSRDLGAMAYQPPSEAGLRVLRPTLFLEILDDDGKPAEPGQTGRLLWTSTVCRGTPFLRYENGDVGSFDESCRDESGIHTIRELQGRNAGLFRLPDGKTVSANYWNHLLKDYQEVRQFQVVLRKDSSIQLRLKGTPFSPEREAGLRTALSNLLGLLPVEIAWVESIPLTRDGKLIQVNNE
jgi:phenylacetate-CoA ligase